MPKIALAGVTLLPQGAKAVLSFAAANGYEAIEIYGDYPQAHFEAVDASTKESLRRMAENAGISLAVHAPFLDINLASFNRGIRVESVQQMKGTLDMAADLGAEIVVIHAGTVTGGGRMGREICFNNAIESIKEIAQHAAIRGVLLCLENILFEKRAVDKTYQDMMTIKERVASPHLKFTFDFGHARLAGNIDEGLMTLAQDIRHLHLTDNYGSKDDHLIIGKGNTDYTPYLDFLRAFQGLIVLEVMGLVEDGGARALESREYVMKLLYG